jgi:hypothetical protein
MFYRPATIAGPEVVGAVRGLRTCESGCSPQVGVATCHRFSVAPDGLLESNMIEIRRATATRKTGAAAVIGCAKAGRDPVAATQRKMNLSANASRGHSRKR